MDLKNESYRKLLHLLLLAIPLAYYHFGKSEFLTIMIPISLITVALDYQRRESTMINNIFTKILRPILRTHELDGKKLCGASWVAIGASVNFLCFREEIAILAFSILVICDAAAAVIGKAFPSKEFFEKTFNGSLAFFVSGTILVIICAMFFHLNIWFYIFGLFALFCTTVIEARPSLVKIDDNFTIPIAFSVIMTLFDLIWNYMPN